VRRPAPTASIVTTTMTTTSPIFNDTSAPTGDDDAKAWPRRSSPRVRPRAVRDVDVARALGRRARALPRRADPAPRALGAALAPSPAARSPRLASPRGASRPLPPAATTPRVARLALVPPAHRPRAMPRRSAPRRGHHRRVVVAAAAGMSDPEYWDDVVALMTPSVDVDLSPPALAALAIGGVLVLGHSWESVEASRGWRARRDAAARSAAARSAAADDASSTAPSKEARESGVSSSPLPSPPPPPSTGNPPRTTRALAPMTSEERALAADAARRRRADAADRAVAAFATERDAREPKTTRNAAPPPTILVCVNAACAKRGGDALLKRLTELTAEKAEADGKGGDASSVRCAVVRKTRCMDACAGGCVARVAGVAGASNEYHVAVDEAETLLELATGERRARSARVARGNRD